MTQPARSRVEHVIAMLGHELRNPLAAAIAGLSVATELTDAADPRYSFLERAGRDLRRLSGLLDGYLTLGGRRQLRFARVTLAGPLARLREREPRVVTSGDVGLAIAGDEALLERVLDNLVDNAITAGANSILIAVRRRGNRVVLKVHDDGPGVPADLRPRVFEPFVTGGNGSGLGLAVVAEVVAAHAGRIALLDSARGAHFEIDLPLAIATATTATAP